MLLLMLSLNHLRALYHSRPKLTRPWLIRILESY
jgi:hypothetical protein